MRRHAGLVRIITILSMTAFVVVLTACSGRGKAATSAPTSDRKPAETLSRNNGPAVSDLSGLGAREALALANKWKTTEKGVTTFVDTRKVSFELPDGKKTSIPLPDAKMVVAIAPYVNSTHPCEVHYMSGCQGEMVNTPVKVYGKTADGLVVVDDTITTMENGFFELWLARDLEIQLTIEYEGKRASQVITTNTDSNTCITTMRLL